MRYQSFIKQHRNNWKELEETLKKMNKSRTKIDAGSLERFEALYLSTSQQLSYCQTYFPNEEITPYLNELVAKAHNLFYRNKVSSFSQIKDFFKHHFVFLLTAQWRFVIVSVLLFLIGAVGAYLSVINDPAHIYAILPNNIARSVDPTQIGANHGGIDSTAMSLSILTNNIQVAILAFAGGLTLGILTIYLLITNGMMLGGLAALYFEYGKTYDFWAYIVPHGMIELTAIFIAGGAGLAMGYRFLVPGPYPRTYQLKRQAKRSVQLLLGTIPLFIIAGFIEGFITPSPLPLFVKYLFALLTVIALSLYILYGVRTRSHDISVNHINVP